MKKTASAKATKKNKARPKKAVLIVGGVAVLLAILLGLSLFLPQRKPAGTVNGHPFYAEELALYAAQHRAAVAADFATRYQLSSMGSNFWNTDYEGTTPEQALLAAALHSLVQDKIIQQQAAEREIAAPLDFLQVEKAFALENKSRSASAGYGPTTLSIGEYHHYLMTQTADDLKTSLLKNELAPTEKQLRQAFSTLPPEVLRKDFTATGMAFFWEEEQSPHAAAEIHAALARQNFSKALAESLKEQIPSLTWESFSIDTAQIHREDTSALALAELLFSVQPGQGTEYTQESIAAFYWVDNKTGGGFLQYEEAPRFAESKWINDNFNLWIEQQAKQAKVELFITHLPDSVFD